MTRHIPHERLDMWLVQLIQGEISTEDLQELEQAIADDLEILDYCLDFLVVTAGLEWSGREMEDQGAEALVEAIKKGRPVRKKYGGGARFVRFVTRMAAVIVLGLGVAFAIYWMQQNQQPPHSEGAALIAQGHSVKWQDTRDAAETGSPVEEGERFLLEGLAEIKLVKGASVLVKGPCRFAVEGDNAVRLFQGMLSAKVPKQAQGFAVHTQYLSIVDYGTEFGVIVKADGTVETHVFEGKVSLVPPGQTVDAPASMLLPAGIAAKVTPGQPIQKSGANAIRFVRSMPPLHTWAIPGRRLDLGDIVGRGNGFGTGKIGRGVHPADGQPLEEPMGATSVRSVQGYVFLLEWRYIDGVFIPDVSQGMNAVASAGHMIFKDCPDTTGTTLQGICNGGFMAEPGTARAVFPPRLNGVTYGTAEKPALGIHPNAGITFDLDRMRQDNPGVTFQSFKALCGLSESAPQPTEDAVTFWVLVDGEVRFRQPMTAGKNKAVPLTVALATDARFITLVTTTEGPTAYAWAVYAEPHIELAVEP